MDIQLRKITVDQKDVLNNLMEKYLDTSDNATEKHIQNVNRQQELIKRNLCPRCGGVLKLISGKYGEFYGCSNYPKCKFKKNKE